MIHIKPPSGGFFYVSDLIISTISVFDARQQTALYLTCDHMKYLKQLAIILFVSFLGELCAWLLPFPIPGCLYGLALMFAALCLKIIKLEQVEDVSRFMIEIMPLMFTPPAVGLITTWNVLGDVWPKLLLIVVLTTFIVMFVTGHVAQAILHHEQHLSFNPRKWFHHSDIHGGAHPV